MFFNSRCLRNSQVISDLIRVFNDKAGRVPSLLRVLAILGAHFPRPHTHTKQISKISFQYVMYQHYRDMLQFLIVSL